MQQTDFAFVATDLASAYRRPVTHSVRRSEIQTLSRPCRARLRGPGSQGLLSWASPAALAASLQMCRRLSRRAVTEDSNEHAVAVKTWLERFVIGLNFCPWAGPAKLRLVTSLSSSEESVLVDLKEEAQRLARVTGDEATTTLLVCPHVRAWSQFEEFDRFVGEQLDNGMALSAEFGTKVVAFHPDFEHGELHGSVLEEGDVVELPGPSNSSVTGSVLEADAGTDENGEACFRIRLEDGSEQLVAYSYLAELMQMESPEEEDFESDLASSEEPLADDTEETTVLESLAQRAPRPTLHLLRVADVAAALETPGADDVLPSNEVRARELGVEGWRRLMAEIQHTKP